MHTHQQKLKGLFFLTRSVQKPN